MITLDKLKLYEKFEGDIDWVQRTRDKVGLAMSSSGEWDIIEDVVSRWIKVKNGVASEMFQREAQMLLEEKFEKRASEYLVLKMEI